MYFSPNTVKHLGWKEAYGALHTLVEMEYMRNDHLKTSDALNEDERAYFRRIASGEADDAEFDDSLMRLQVSACPSCRPVVLLIDEYDAPVMAGYTYGYCQEVVAFLKAWLTGGLKDGALPLPSHVSRACSASQRRPSFPISTTSRCRRRPRPTPMSAVASRMPRSLPSRSIWARRPILIRWGSGMTGIGLAG